MYTQPAKAVFKVLCVRVLNNIQVVNCRTSKPFKLISRFEDLYFAAERTRKNRDDWFYYIGLLLSLLLFYYFHRRRIPYTVYNITAARAETEMIFYFIFPRPVQRFISHIHNRLVTRMLAHR